MNIQIFLLSIVILIVALVALAVKYYKKQYYTLCNYDGKNLHKTEMYCKVCGANRIDDCEKKEEQTK